MHWFCQWKLLRAKHSNRRSTNIDVQSLHAFGRALPKLPALLGGSDAGAEKPDPSYRRMHALAPTDAMAADASWRR